MTTSTSPQATFPVPRQWKVTVPQEMAAGAREAELVGDFVLGLKVREERFLLWSISFAGTRKMQLSARRDDQDRGWRLTLELVGGKENPLWESELVSELSGEVPLQILALAMRSSGGVWPQSLSVLALAQDSGARDPGEFQPREDGGAPVPLISACCAGKVIAGCVVEFDGWETPDCAACDRLTAPLTLPISGLCTCKTTLFDVCSDNFDVTAAIGFNPQNCRVTLTIDISGEQGIAGYTKTYTLDDFDPYAMHTIQEHGLMLFTCGPTGGCHTFNASIQFYGPEVDPDAPPQRTGDCWNIWCNCCKSRVVLPYFGERGWVSPIVCCKCGGNQISVPGTDGPNGGGGCPNCSASLDVTTGSVGTTMSPADSGWGFVDGGPNYNSVCGGISLLEEFIAGDAPVTFVCHKCDGSLRYYACPTCVPDGGKISCKYRTFGRNANRLIATYTPGGDMRATEFQDNGLEYDFQGGQSGGIIYRIRRPMGPTQAIWTIARYPDATAIIDPTLHRTTYTSASADTLQIVDPYQRITSYTYDASGNVSSYTTPELCITQYRYDGSNRLTSIIAADSTRTTYGYDADGWANRVQYPTGERFTYTYVNQFRTNVIDPAGAVTTLAHDNNRNIISVTTPAGVQTQYRYDDTTKMTARIDPNGARTTYLYTAIDTGVYRQSGEVTGAGTTTYRYGPDGRVTAVINPLNQRTTYVLDGTRIMATIDPLGNRTTNVYSATTGLNIGTINPLGRRTTSVYNSLNQVAATIDPLGNRTSYTYANGQRTVVKDPLGRRTTTVYDLANKVLAEVAPNGARTSYLYDAGRRPLAAIDPAGYRTTNVYSAGRLIATIDPFAKRTTFAFDTRGNRIRVTDPLGNITTTVYDSADRPIAEIDPVLSRTTTVYDSSGRSKSAIDPLGKRTTAVYDFLNRQVATIDPLTYRTTTVYDNLSQPIARIDQLGNRTTTVYNGNRQTISGINALGRRTTTIYDANRNSIATISPLAKRLTTVYDAADRPIARKTPLGFRSTIVYNAASDAVSQLNALGNRTTTVYNIVGQPVATIDARLNRTTTVYDPAGREVAQVNALLGRTTSVFDKSRTVAAIDPLGNRNTAVYDAAGRVIATIDPLSQRTTTNYDVASRKVAMINPLSQRSTTVYDAASRPIAAINPLGNRTTFGYDAVGRPFRITDPNSRITTSIFDRAGKTIATLNALGNRTTMVYNAIGQTMVLIDPISGRNTFTYDAANQRTQLIDPLGRRTTSAYDDDGRQTLGIDARGNRTTYAFDAVSWPTGRRYADGSRATFVYDSVGNRTTMRDSSGRYTYTYDELSRMKTVTLPSAQRTTYAYDAASRRTVLRAPTGGRFTYRYDATGRITEVRNPEDSRTTFAYDAAGRRTVKKLSNATRTSFTYDNADQVTTVANMNKTATGFLTKFDYKYDPAGNRLAVKENSGDRVTWTYDATYQLLSERRSGTHAYRNTFTYDSRGNRLVNNQGGTRTTTTYDAANQIRYSQAAAGRTTYTFDANGNQQRVLDPSGNRTTTSWDFENQPTLYKLPAGTRVTMAYNADNQRVQKDASSGTTKFLWDRQNYLAEANGSNTIQTIYTNEPQPIGNLISTRLGTTTVWHQFDALGSTTGLSNSAGNATTDVWIYDSWGNVVSRAGTTAALLQWVGELGYYFDSELTEFYVRRRPYGPTLGRWTTGDPIGFTDGINHWLYGANRPQVNVDPSGLLWEQSGKDPDIYELTDDLDEDDNHLYALAQQVSGDFRDWECIWPLGPKDPLWTNYPVGKCHAKADVSNLTTKKNREARFGVFLTVGDDHGYVTEMEKFVGVTRQWRSLPGLTGGDLIAGKASYGANPISLAYLVGHHEKKDGKLFMGSLNQQGAPQNAFDVSSLYDVWNAYVAKVKDPWTRASSKKGPPRCWFTRTADVWGIGCNTSTIWMTDWATRALRPGATAHGTTDFIYIRRKEGTAAWIGKMPPAANTFEKMLDLPGWATALGSL